MRSWTSRQPMLGSQRTSSGNGGPIQGSPHASHSLVMTGGRQEGPASQAGGHSPHFFLGVQRFLGDTHRVIGAEQSGFTTTDGRVPILRLYVESLDDPLVSLY